MDVFNNNDNLQLTIFLNEVISEDQLNQQIISVQDVSVLRSLLEIKLQLITTSKHSPIIYPIDFILNKLSSTNVEELCHIIQVALMIQKDESKFVALLQLIHKNLASLVKPLQYLKLLQVALTLCKSKREKESFIKYADANCLDSIISKIVFKENKTINNYLNVSILPKYLNLNCESSKHLFEQISEYSLKTKVLDIFCAIPEIFIENNDKLLRDDSFWYLLQTNLNHSNGTFQKQALYLLKIALKYCQKRENFNTISGVVSWNEHCRQEVFLAWNHLFILYEVAREKQLHLIEPIYQLIPTIQLLHPSWVSSIFRILLFHSQVTVCTHTLLELFKSNWYYNDVFSDIVQCFICVLNKTEFTMQKDIWEELSKLVRNFKEEHLHKLLEESAKIAWIPPVCYKFYNSVFANKLGVSVPLPLCSQILSNLRRLPHKFIREECIRIVINFTQKSYFEGANFRTYTELNKIFFRDNFRFWKSDNLVKFIPDIEMIIESWIGNENIVLSEIDTIVNVVRILKNPYLENILYKAFIRNELAAPILDRLCTILYLRKKNVISYVSERLLRIDEKDDSYLKCISSLLTVSDSTVILSTCFDVLLNDSSNNVQVEVCFSLINSSLPQIENNSRLEEVLSKWENKACNPNVCICLLQMLTKQRLRPEHFLKTIRIFENVLETQDLVVVPEIFLQLKLLINACEEIDALLHFLDLCIQKLPELKGGKYFKASIENFVNSILLNNAILHEQNGKLLEKCQNILHLMIDWIHSSEDVGYSLSKNLYLLSQVDPSIAFSFIRSGLTLLTFGDILRKDQRAEYDVCQIISNNNTDKQKKNPSFRKSFIRGQMIKYIQNILSNDQDGKKANVIRELLTEKYLTYLNKRCFSDSYVHLVKLRILQVFLLIHDHVKTKDVLIEFLLNSLCTDSHQLSNKFIIIWLLVRLLYIEENCLELISEKIDSSSKVHSSTISTFIPVLYHIAVLKNDVRFWFQVIKKILPWTMGAHFNLRFHAQISVKKMYDVLCDRGHEELCVQFKEMIDVVSDVLNKTDREVDGVDSYIINVFNPITDFNLQTIYYNIPYITNVTNDEYENMPHVLNFSVDSRTFDYLRTVNLKLDATPPYDSVSSTIIQKKIIPRDKINKKKGDLIVVASLIDKIPNLGGLSRTSEVFGVKNLAIKSLAIVNNAEFQNLSMSSENWIDIVEVKINQLQSYLLLMKEKGYSVIGAEQTSESVKLDSFKFPFKSLLLLGNEKEGIPPNLLSLIDTCVEIPQLGVIRSLNVHVAAATFMWEYTKEHLL